MVGREARKLRYQRRPYRHGRDDEMYRSGRVRADEAQRDQEARGGEATAHFQAAEPVAGLGVSRGVEVEQKGRDTAERDYDGEATEDGESLASYAGDIGP